MIRSYLETYPIVTYKPIRRNDMKQSDTYKEIAPAYQIKEFHSPGHVIMHGFRSQTPPPNIFSSDLDESQEWSGRPGKPRNLSSTRRIPVPDMVKVL